MTKQHSAFAVGQTVVHRVHGIGTISGRRKESVAGCTTDVYVIKCPGSSGRIFTPVKKTGDVRPVGTPDDLTKAIKILKQPPKERPQHWQIHARRYEDRINSGCLERVAEVIRDLHLETRTESMRGRELYERAVTKLVEEAAVIWKLSKEDALKDLRERSGRRLHHPHFIVRQLSLPVETPPAVTADEEMAAVTVRPDDVLYYPDRQRSVSVYKSAEVVELDGERLDLRKTDFALFYLIYSKEGATISAAAIADELNMLVQTVSARISQLRTRLGYAQFVIKTTSDGYQFVFPNDDH